MGKKFVCGLFGIGLVVAVMVSSAIADKQPRKRASRQSDKVVISVRPIGPPEAVLEAAKARLMANPAVRREGIGKNVFLLSFEPLENGTPNPTEFRAMLYDYLSDRTIVATGDLAGRRQIEVKEEVLQPVPSDEEFDAAVALLRADPRFRAAFDSNSVMAFRPMPPVSLREGTVERMVNVGLDSKGPTGRNEVVSVNLKRGEVIRYPENAPASALAAPEACGVPSAGQSTTSNGTAGQYQMSVTDHGAPRWDMLIVRPSASSGLSTKRSAIEVRDVRYKGKSVLKRGHVPILNVQYVGGQCGPYRDWQYQEDMFQTPASGNTDPAPGIRIVASGQVPTTALESGNDTGNFRGVAIYTQGTETVLVSELQAGWYRYISEWRFDNDGTIRPRFGFGATDNSCVCFAHNHHVYWRLDFDVVNPNNNVYQIERGRRFGKPITTETFMNRNIATNKSLLIQNGSGDEGYLLVPNVFDGVVDTFGVHDLWVLAFKGTPTAPTELEDGISCVTCSTAYIQIDPFVNNESVSNTDVVVWYGAHFLHNDSANLIDPNRSPQILTGAHVVGPDLRPIRW